MRRFAWASTETRKIIKNEERIIHFLDEKGTVHQTSFRHHKAAVCEACSLDGICAGLFEMGNGDKFIFDIGSGSMRNIASLMIPHEFLTKVFLKKRF